MMRRRLLDNNDGAHHGEGLHHYAAASPASAKAHNRFPEAGEGRRWMYGSRKANGKAIVMKMMCDGGGWGLWGLVPTIATVVIWALVITAIVLVARYLISLWNASRTAGPTQAEDLIAQRYARGEIDDDEYRRRTTLLREGS
jgi:putative membrane protein